MEETPFLKGLTIPHEDMIDTDDEDQKAPVKFSDARSVEISKVTVTEKPTGGKRTPHHRATPYSAVARRPRKVEE